MIAHETLQRIKRRTMWESLSPSGGKERHADAVKTRVLASFHAVHGCDGRCGLYAAGGHAHDGPGGAHDRASGTDDSPGRSDDRSGSGDGCSYRGPGQPLL